MGGYFGVRALTDEDDEAPAPPVALNEEDDEPEAAKELGFPGFATKNTTRIGGDDETADAAGAALATFPSVGGVDRPAAVTLVPSSDWAAGIAASVLVSDPIRAPLLLSDRDGVPDQTETALDALRPEGSPETTDAQVLRIGDAEAPGDLRAVDVPGGSPAELADAVDRLRQRLSDTKPENIVLASTAPLSASGKWGPLLVTDEADVVPTPLRGFLLDIKPGYRSDPSRAFYNHAWLIGNNSAMSVAFQAQVDDALELVQLEGAPEPRSGPPE